MHTLPKFTDIAAGDEAFVASDAAEAIIFSYDQPQAIPQLLARIRAEHQQIIESGQLISMASVFPDYIAFSQDLEIHPLAAQSEANTRAFCERHGIMTDKFNAYVTMTPWLFPKATTLESLDIINEINALLFYIDEKGSANAEDTDEVAKNDIKRKGMELLQLVENPATVTSPDNELANSTREILQQLYRLADPEWIRRFVGGTAAHLREAIQGVDAKTQTGDLQVMTLQRYIDETRIDDSGMIPTIQLMELAAGKYIPYEQILSEAPEIYDKLNRAQYLVAAFPAVTNDLFSYQKEVIEANSAYNAIPIVMNQTGLTLREAAQVIMDYVANTFREYMQIAQEIRSELSNSEYSWREAVLDHLIGLDDGAKATWIWQYAQTDRYQRPDSIFIEALSGIEKAA